MTTFDTTDAKKHLSLSLALSLCVCVMADDLAASTPATSARAHALSKILRRRALRVWASKSAQERDALATDIHQLFSSPSALSSSGGAAPRAVTRRPGVEEVKNCMLSTIYASLPPSCAPLRGEIWQVLLNVYKRNQHGSSAQDFDRMIQRLGKLPRDPILVQECADVSALLATAASDADAQPRLQRELEILLVWFLTTKSVAYSRGMARVVAPFFLLQLPLPTIYDCFYQFCASFLPHLITADDTVGPERQGDSAPTESTTIDAATDDDEKTQKRLAHEAERQVLVEQLVSYHDPHLAHVLAQWCGNAWSAPGRVVPTGFFTGALYETLAPHAYTFVVDQILLTGDTRVSLFVLVAMLLDAKDALVASTSAADVTKTLESVVERVCAADADAAYVQFLCLFASRLRSRTPQSFACALRDATSASMAQSASRRATDLAFGVTEAPASDKREPVDMTQWVKKESRSIAGKIFWYHTQTGTTQWEHPAEKHDPAPTLFALSISVDEVASQVMGERTGSNTGTSGLHYFVVDCRGLRSSEDLKSGRIPAAYTLDPSVFDSPDLIAKNMAALDALQSKVHIVLVGHGVGVPPELTTTDEVKTSVRDAVRLDADALNRAALFFQKRGFRFVSCLDGGYASWHAFMRDAPACSPQELLNHVASECHYCRYDTILRTGEDPLKLKQQQQQPSLLFRRKKKSAMPTTTDLPVNGGEGDASIISTSSLHNNRPSTSSMASLSQLASGSGNRMSLTLSRSSISNMRTKLADVKMPKLQWGRRTSSSAAAATATGDDHAQGDSGSSSETATVDDGGSDRGSSATDDVEDKQPHDELLFGDDSEDDVAALQAKLEAQVSPRERKKSFVGVFTIDYSDDEDDDASGSGAAGESGAAPVVVAPTQTA